jgi:hypothetical protein
VAGETARAVAADPTLWWEAVRTVGRLAPRRWWARWPFLPLPDAAYWDFRLTTAVGDGRGAPDRRLRGPEVAAYLRWCRRMPSADR